MKDSNETYSRLMHIARDTNSSVTIEWIGEDDLMAAYSEIIKRTTSNIILWSIERCEFFKDMHSRESELSHMIESNKIIVSEIQFENSPEISLNDRIDFFILSDTFRCIWWNNICDFLVNMNNPEKCQELLKPHLDYLEKDPT
jgi:hypothetical protein